jgi:methionyl-tRNA formyltransferase
LKSPADQAEFAALGADAAVVVAYGLILPQAVLDAPKFGCLNIHASLLPRWRGAAPIHRAIMAGDAQTGVCIMQMEAGLDTGPVLLRDAMPIDDTDTTALLHDKLSAQGAALIVQALGQLPDLVAQPQPDDGVTYAHKIDKAEAQIDWTRSAVEIDRQIRGLSPFPGAWFDAQGDRVKCLASRVVDRTGPAGHILSQSGELIIACGQGAVSITRAQRAGKSAQDIVDFLHGFQFGDDPLV